MSFFPERTPEQVEQNRAMNRMIFAGARRGRTTGTFARSGGQPTPSDPALRERLSGALNDLESAQRSGRDDAIDYAEHRLSQVIDEARAGRQEREQARDPETGQFVSFDGGVQRSPGPGPGTHVETATDLMLRALQAAGSERRERPGRTRVI